MTILDMVHVADEKGASDLHIIAGGCLIIWKVGEARYPRPG